MPIYEEYHIHVARRHVTAWTKLLGMSRLESHYVATAISELANNLFFHSQSGGIIHFYHIKKNGKSGIEIIAHDKGPGIINIEQAMQDGFSTNGGLGGGLGGMQRLMDEFEITSEAGVGTDIVMRKWVT
ncbi:MAG: ATP-binding protein [Mariprofundus sp.]|nr:ATP-binding protein [Mariprofundus sp.]